MNLPKQDKRGRFESGWVYINAPIIVEKWPGLVGHPVQMGAFPGTWPCDNWEKYGHFCRSIWGHIFDGEDGECIFCTWRKP